MDCMKPQSIKHQYQTIHKSHTKNKNPQHALSKFILSQIISHSKPPSTSRTTHDPFFKIKKEKDTEKINFLKAEAKKHIKKFKKKKKPTPLLSQSWQNHRLPTKKKKNIQSDLSTKPVSHTTKHGFAMWRWGNGGTGRGGEGLPAVASSSSSSTGKTGETWEDEVRWSGEGMPAGQRLWIRKYK